MQIIFNISTLSIALFSVSFVCLMYICFVYCRMLWVVRRRKRMCNEMEPSAAVVLPKASVVVYANEDASVMEASLSAILSQTYPGSFEVIVVNEGAGNEVDMLVTRLKATYSNLYLTFIPDSSRNISRRKLAITLGVKAAKGDVIVVTDGATMVASDSWLEKMVAPFTDSRVEVVLGYAAPLLSEHSWMGRLTRWFDIAADDVAWLSSAISGKPYRASGNNVAYRRELFFRNRGFQNHLNISAGDDDLFINEIATEHNSVVMIPDDTLCTWGTQYDMPKRMRRYRQSHSFTGRSLPKLSRALMWAGGLMIWAVVGSALAGAFFAGIENAFGWALAAVLIIAMLVVLIVNWRKTIIMLGGPALLFTIPFLAATRPFRSLLVNLRAGSYKNANYTWQ